MYDLEILVPAEEKLANRFADFKKWGFRNIGKYKVKVILAASSDNNASFFQNGWPDGLEVEIAITPYKHVAQRIYHYYDSIIKPDTAKWYCRIDEDSMNDISGLMYNLETFFDHDREYHMTGDINWDVQEVERKILTELGFNHWYRHPSDTPPHEYEVSVTSNAAMKRILNDSNAKKYFKIRKEIADGYGDHGLCFCARMVKVHPIEVKFLTVKSELCKFSEFRGNFNHIHWISRDKNPSILNWLDSMTPEKEPLYKNKSFLYTTHDKKRWIKLSSNNVIEEVFVWDNHRKAIGLWSVTPNEKLTFYLEDMKQNNPLIVFETASGSNESITVYEFRDHQLKTGQLSELISG